MNLKVEQQKLCFGCSITLSEPYIRCSECMPPFCFLCLNCYASGKEFGLHENNHPYQIIRSNFPILSQNWSAAEEIKLLEAIEKFGLGNWDSVSLWLPNKSKEECMSHYFQCYVYNPHPKMPKFKESLLSTDNWPTPVPYTVSDMPPRPAASSHRCIELAGYMPARGDFAYEHDNHSELSIKTVNFEHVKDNLTFSLMMTALEIFNSQLKERARRKSIMREYGLISQKGSFLTNPRYNSTIGRINEKLASFVQLISADDFYSFIEGLHLENELKREIGCLQEYREMGITNLYSVPTYKKLKRQNLESQQQKRCALTEVINHVTDERTLKSWISKKTIKEELVSVSDIGKLMVNRKPATPLDILGIPGYEKLNEKERELCSTLRLIPNKYLQFKAILINECEKFGSLKLRQARALIKIDVNKTRKIYNYLIESGLIHNDN